MNPRLQILSIWLLLCTVLPELCHAQKLPSLIPYRKGDLWGFSDSAGKIFVRPQFKNAGWSEGKYGFVVQDSNHYIFGTKGKLLYKSRSDSLIDSLADRGIILTSDAKQSFQKRRFQRKYGNIVFLGDKTAIVCKEIKRNDSTFRLYGIIDTNGKVLLPIEYESYQFFPGAIQFYKNGVFTDFMDNQGRSLMRKLPLGKEDYIEFYINFIVLNARQTSLPCIIYNKTGKIIFTDSSRHKQVYIDVKGIYALLTVSSYSSNSHIRKNAIIDTSGKIVHPFIENDLNWAGKQKLWENIDNTWCLTDLKGNIIQKTNFGEMKEIYKYKNKLYWASLPSPHWPKSYWMVDSNGRTLSDTSYRLLSAGYNEGLFPVFIYTGDKSGPIEGVIDTSGKIVIPFEYKSTLKNMTCEGVWEGVPFFKYGLTKVIWKGKEIYIDRYNRRYYED